MAAKRQRKTRFRCEIEAWFRERGMDPEGVPIEWDWGKKSYFARLPARLKEGKGFKGYVATYYNPLRRSLRAVETLQFQFYGAGFYVYFLDKDGEIVHVSRTARVEQDSLAQAPPARRAVRKG
jgi:hypothetical protein